jgi:hypothetical protein
MASALGISPCPRQARAGPRVSVRHSLILRSWPNPCDEPRPRATASAAPSWPSKAAACAERVRMSKSATAPAWLATTNWFGSR